MRESDTREINKLCLRCIRHCKQSASMVMLECPRFQPRPFKSDRHKFEQMDLF